MTILDHFNGTPREVQATALLELEHKWADHDVFVVDGSTGIGKSKLAGAVGRWSKSSAVIVPNSVHVGQYDQGGEGPVFQGKAKYACMLFPSRSCEVTEQQCRKLCDGCHYEKAKLTARASKHYVTNYHCYYAHDFFRKTLIVDEAHAVIPFVKSLVEKKLWWHKFKFPTSMSTEIDVLAWVEQQLAKAPNKDLRQLHQEILCDHPNFIVRLDEQAYRGELEPVLRLIPVSVAKFAGVLWPPNKVSKLLLMSATVNDMDLQDMGLTRKRVARILAPSPIPVDQRPVYADACCDVSYETIDKAVRLLADRVQSRMAAHPDTKGVVHCTYDMAARLRMYLDSPRLVWHTPGTRSKAVDSFKAASYPAVLVACGFYEGLDLPDDLGRWQSILKVPFLSLGDEAVKWRAAQNPAWYAWQAIKYLVQAAGRICRGVDDYGVTYIEDGKFSNLWTRHRKLFPKDFADAVRIVTPVIGSTHG